MNLMTLLAVVMPLEWNATFDTKVPYEVEVSPAKIGAKAFVVKADGRAVPTAASAGRLPGTVRLRFRVPDGTKKLALEGGEAIAAQPASEDNLFAGALTAAAVPRWKSSSVKVAPAAEGLLLTQARGRGSVTYEQAVPEGLAGRSVQFTVEVANVSELAWPNNIFIDQYDAKGRLLHETVTDPRWSSHIRPVGKSTAVMEPGRIHPDAVKLSVVFTLAAVESLNDDCGYPITRAERRAAKLLVKRLSLRPGELLPFPKLNDAFFSAGVSGREGDAALKLGGAKQAAVWYQTRSWGAWSQPRGYDTVACQMRDERLVFFPAGAGTEEVWLKPDWNERETRKVCIFSGAQQNVHPKVKSKKRIPVRGRVLELAYVPATQTLSFMKEDLAERQFAGEAKVAIAKGAWTHVALTWNPGGEAAVYVNGRKALAVPLKGYEAMDIAAHPDPNDADVVEAYLGADCWMARNIDAPNPKAPFLTGDADLWRVSSGVRYAGDFTPARDYGRDADTRALFTFDRTYDGVSGTGFGWIPLTLYAREDRVDHRLAADGRTIQYYPDAVVETADPDRQLDWLNYPMMPSEEDYLSGRKVERKTAVLEIGGRMSVEAPKGVRTDYVEIENVGEGTLVHPLLVGEGEVDPRSFGDIRDTLCAKPMSDRERANAVFQYVLGASDYFMNHTCYFPMDGGDKPGDVEYLALAMLNSYCGFECGPLNSMTKNIFAVSGGLPATQTAGYGHSFEQVFFDGKNHVYDLSAQKFFPAFDNETAACLGEMEDQPGLKVRAYGNPDHFIRNGSRHAWANEVPYQAKVAVSLRPGERFRAWFDNDGEVNELQCSHQTDNRQDRDKPGVYYKFDDEVHARGGQWTVYRINRFFPHFGVGFHEFEGAPAADNPAFADNGENFDYVFQTVYPVVAATYEAELKDGSRAALDISTDKGETYRPLKPGKLRYEVRARYAYRIRVKARMADVKTFRARSEVQLNARIFPGRLKDGANTLVLKGTGAGKAKVTVAWRSNAKRLAIRGGVHAGTIPGAETQFALLDPRLGPSVFAVEGASADATVRTSANLRATLADGRLTVASADGTRGFGFVTIVDGDVEKSLAVLVCAGARLVLADAFKPSGDVRIAVAGPDRINGAVVFGTKAGSAEATFAPIPAGRYATMMLCRFEAQQEELRSRPRFMLEIGGAKGLGIGRPMNGGCNFYKAMYGRKGERANWKWDYPLRPDLNYYVEMMRVTELKATEKLRLETVVDRGFRGENEVAAMLLVPEPDEELYCDLIKVLCGLNNQFWKVR